MAGGATHLRGAAAASKKAKEAKEEEPVHHAAKKAPAAKGGATTKKRGKARRVRSPVLCCRGCRGLAPRRGGACSRRDAAHRAWAHASQPSPRA